MHILADLRAAADRHPGIDHRAFIDEGADVHEARHQDDILGDMGTGAGKGARHGAETGSAEFRLAPAAELARHLIPPVRPTRAALDQGIVVETEGQQHGLFEPLVDLPASRGRLGDARQTGIEQVQCLADGQTNVPAGVETDIGAIFPGGFDCGDQRCVGHGSLFCRNWQSDAPIVDESGLCTLVCEIGARHMRCNPPFNRENSNDYPLP